MVTLLFISVLGLILLSVAVYFWQKPPNTPDRGNWLPPPNPPSFLSDIRVNEVRLNELGPAAADTSSQVDAETFQNAIEAIRAWQASPNKNTAAKLLHVAAQADDAKNYGRAVELILMSWRDRSLSDMSASELQTLIHSEYWVLSSHTRTSGAGFVLKQTLANANRELESTNNPT
jgi:hypothetical protein